MIKKIKDQIENKEIICKLYNRVNWQSILTLLLSNIIINRLKIEEIEEYGRFGLQKNEM